MNTQSDALSRLRPVDYEKPPVVETELGLFFAPIKGWTLFHFGLLWGRLRERYPNSEMRLPSGTVELEDLDIKLSPDVRLEALPLRCWFLDASGNQLVQVQANEFIRNWRAIESEQKYVHYSELRPLFSEDWTTYLEFLRQEGLAQPSVFLCQVTYINHFVKGREWNTLDDIGKLLQGVTCDISGASMSSLSFVATIAANELRVDAIPALRGDGTPIVQVTFNVSGKPASNSETDLLAKLDECHNLLVETFAKITAHELQTRVWRRIR